MIRWRLRREGNRLVLRRVVDLTEYLEQSCRESGVPLYVEDPGVLARVARVIRPSS